MEALNEKLRSISSEDFAKTLGSLKEILRERKAYVNRSKHLLCSENETIITDRLKTFDLEIKECLSLDL